MMHFAVVKLMLFHVLLIVVSSTSKIHASQQGRLITDDKALSDPDRVHSNPTLPHYPLYDGDDESTDDEDRPRKRQKIDHEDDAWEDNYPRNDRMIESDEIQDRRDDSAEYYDLDKKEKSADVYTRHLAVDRGDHAVQVNDTSIFGYNLDPEALQKLRLEDVF
jgi:hypothetical protein